MIWQLVEYSVSIATNELGLGEGGDFNHKSLIE